MTAIRHILGLMALVLILSPLTTAFAQNGADSAGALLNRSVGALQLQQTEPYLTQPVGLQNITPNIPQINYTDLSIQGAVQSRSGAVSPASDGFDDDAADFEY